MKKADEISARLADSPSAESSAPTSVPRGPQVLARASRCHEGGEPSMPGSDESELPIPLLSRKHGTNYLAWLIFLVALAFAVAGTVYYIRYVTPQYVTDFQFTVRETSSGQSSGSTAQGGASPLPGIGLGGGGSSGYLDTYMVSQYLRSPTLPHDLSQKIDLRRLFDGTAIDPLSRLNQNSTEEQLAAYIAKHVQVSFDPMTSAAEVMVSAFSAKDSFALTSAILDQARLVVNQIDHSMVIAMVGYTQREVADAKNQLEKVSVNQLAGSAAAPVSQGSSPAYTNEFMISKRRQLNLRFAEQTYSNALSDLQQAQQTAARSQRYVVVFVPPIVADSPTFPVRWEEILKVWFFAAMVAAILGLLTSAIRERMQ